MVLEGSDVRLLLQNDEGKAPSCLQKVLEVFLEEVYFKYLVSAFPEEKNYWNKRVLSCLEPHEIDRLKRKDRKCGSLDLLGLLKVVRDNWYDPKNPNDKYSIQKIFQISENDGRSFSYALTKGGKVEGRNSIIAHVSGDDNASPREGDRKTTNVYEDILTICSILPLHRKPYKGKEKPKFNQKLIDEMYTFLSFMIDIGGKISPNSRDGLNFDIKKLMSREYDDGITWDYTKFVSVPSVTDRKVRQLSRGDYDVGTTTKVDGIKRSNEEKDLSDSQKKSIESEAEALYDLAMDYANGSHNVRLDRKKALLNLEMAAKLDLPKAQCKLSEWYYRGEIVNKDEKKAFHWARKAAELGDRRGQNYVGIYYSKGIGVDKDETTAREWFIASAIQGYGGAQFNLALDYEYGDHGINQNLQKAIEWYKKAEKQGHVEAQFRLGVCYESRGSMPEAIKWYKKAEKQGHVRANRSLGFCYEFGGDGVEENLKEAVKWYKRAVRHGDVDACYNIARCYERGGNGLEKNLKEAIRWYERIAEQGDVDACHNVARCYERGGYGLEKNLQKAVEYYTKAAENGHLDAWGDAGRCYEQGGYGLERNIQKAVECYTKAEDRDSWYNAARCYEQGGYGLEKNLQKAVEYYTKAAEKLHADAQLWLAHYSEYGSDDLNPYEVMKQYKEAASLRHTLLSEWPMWVFYDYGDGESKNSQEAFEWYKKEAEQGQVKAMFNMGVYYERGHVVDKNLKEAVEWYKRAAEQGQVDAMYNLGVCYEQGGYGIEKNLKEAMKWYKTAAEHGYVDAMFNLGVCYEQGGEGVEKNLKEAMEWYKKAAETGEEEEKE